MIEEIADYLEENNIGTVGTDIFINDLPATPDSAVLLINAPSGIQNPDYDVRYLNIDFWTRNNDMALGSSKLQNIYDLLVRGANFETASHHIYSALAESNVEYLNKDSMNRKIHRLSIRFTYRKLNIS